MAENRNDLETENQIAEVDLMDYIDVLCKWKSLIIVGTIFSILIAGIISYRMPFIYKINTVIEIGSYSRYGGKFAGGDFVKESLIENPAVLVEKIRGGIYDIGIQTALNIRENDFPEIIVKNPMTTPLIELSIESAKTEKAIEILKSLDNLILKDHVELIKMEKYNLDNDIKVIENRMSLPKSEKESIKKRLLLNKKGKEQLKKQLENVLARITDLDREKMNLDRSANPNNTLSLLLFSNEIQENREYYNDLQNRLTIDLEQEEVNLKNQLENQEKILKSLVLEKDKFNAQLQAFRDTRVVKNASKNNEPIGPRKRRITFIAGILSFAALIFISFFIEYLYRAKQGRRQI